MANSRNWWADLRAGLPLRCSRICGVSASAEAAQGCGEEYRQNLSASGGVERGCTVALTSGDRLVCCLMRLDGHCRRWPGPQPLRVAQRVFTTARADSRSVVYCVDGSASDCLVPRRVMRGPWMWLLSPRTAKPASRAPSLVSRVRAAKGEPPGLLHAEAPEPASFVFARTR